MVSRLNWTRFFRFSLGTLLFAMLSLAGYLGGRRAGYQEGYRTGADRLADEEVTLQIYPVDDIVEMIGISAVQEVKELITLTVEHESWAVHGTGDGEIMPDAANRRLIITQTGKTHEQVQELLAQLRHLMTVVDAREVVQTCQTAASTQKSTTLILRAMSVKERPGGPSAAKWAPLVDRLFDNAVANLTDLWDDPDFEGSCTEQGFPAWSLAQRLATWPRGDGVAYLAVEDEATLGRVLLCGWRPDD